MNRPLPLWLLAVIPATIAGHALTYALSGRSMADGHHGWLQPLLEGSLAVLIVVALVLLRDVLVQAQVVARRLTERSALELWSRMAPVQCALFFLAERLEGTHTSVLGYMVQILIALLAAFVLCSFAGMLDSCARGTLRAARYLQRLCNQLLTQIDREPYAPALALAVSAGANRFGRAPPRAL